MAFFGGEGAENFCQALDIMAYFRPQGGLIARFSPPRGVRLQGLRRKVFTGISGTDPFLYPMEGKTFIPSIRGGQWTSGMPVVTFRWKPCSSKLLRAKSSNRTIPREINANQR